MSTILIVDDDPEFLGAAEQMLISSGYEVILAKDGHEAVRILESKHHGIALAIVDLSLPGINGFELIGAISRRPTRIKIIATTGVYTEAFLEMTETLGAHAVIRKALEGRPLAPDDWLPTVRRLIGKSETLGRTNVVHE